MCILRFLQRKKFIAHVKSVNGSEYYCDGLHKSLNPDYATTPCLQHGVVAVDGKLIPFTYPTNNPKQAILWNGQPTLSHNKTATTTATDNGTIRLNTNPMNRLDNDNSNDQQENFYHTLTPFTTTQSQYGEHSCTPSIGYISERSNLSTCPIHHHIINYPSDTFPLKTKDNIKFVTNTPTYHSHHHGTCQRHQKSKRITTPIINESKKSLDSFYSKKIHFQFD